MQNKESKFAETPGVRFHSDAIKGHANVKAHKDALSAEGVVYLPTAQGRSPLQG